MTAHRFARTLWNRRAKCNETRTKSTASDLGIRTVCAVLLFMLAAISLAHGQNPQIVPCPTPGSQNLLTIPAITRTPDGVLRATIKNVDGLRTVWGAVGIPGQSTTDARCASQYMRFYIGEDTRHPQPWPTTSDPLPGPTLRARVGDLVEITFQNLVNPQHFANTLDRGEEGEGNIDGCDVVTANSSRPDWIASKPYRLGATIKPLSNNAAGYVYTSTKAGTSGATAPVFPQTPGQTVTDGTVVWTNQNAPIYPTGGDYMPDCLHGSSTSNLHFHGTHTTPSTSGDNVLLFVHPTLRGAGVLEPSDAEVKSNFAKIFSACETNGSPTKWEQLPPDWRKLQEALLKKYDATAPYKGQPGKLPHMMQLWPPNEAELAQGLWPQFNIGAFPYCFRLPGFNESPSPGAPPTLMGQAPGTQWYHAHKHGSTALNVANGMTGAFIIEGKYDDELQKFYGSKLHEQVLVVQQLSSTPFPVLDPSHTGGPGAARPPISVNGRRQPIVTMQPGEVQMWRIVNGDFRDAVRFVSFTPEGSTQPCNPSGPQTVVTPCVSWRQIAQDGVQFDFTNYQRLGSPNNSFNLSPANRSDLLVKAPTQPGTYVLQAIANTGVNLQTCSSSAPAGCQTAPDADYSFPLLTVKVAGNPITPAMDFIQNQSDFPQLPTFLSDIDETTIFTKRTLVFGAGNTTIDGLRFDPNKVNQAMLLNTAEEWTVMNQANDKAHPFHIHINPFQITELFEPNSQAATTKGNPCYVDPNDPSTFKPCPSQQPQAPFVWWDTFGIPTGAQFDITSQCTNSNDVKTCPKKLQPYTVCSGTCTETIPGWFRMRSRFVDFTGQYVIHCHILIHEDRGMMQLVEVVTDKTLYTHH
jgi:FtsP/CotA-like multicopper oxidase with cupredoxin domain